MTDQELIFILKKQGISVRRRYFRVKGYKSPGPLGKINIKDIKSLPLHHDIDRDILEKIVSCLELNPVNLENLKLNDEIIKLISQTKRLYIEIENKKGTSLSLVQMNLQSNWKCAIGYNITDNIYEFKVYIIKNNDIKLLNAVDTCFKNIVIHGNQSFVLEDRIDCNILNKLIKDYILNTDDRRILDYPFTFEKLNGITYLNFTKHSLESYKCLNKVNVIPELYITEKGSKLLGKVNFNYQYFYLKPEANQPGSYVFNDITMTMVKRDNLIEKTCINSITSHSWSWQSNNNFIFDNSDLELSLNSLISDGWHIFVNDKELKKQTHSKVMVSKTNIDWLDLNIEFNYGNQHIDAVKLYKNINEDSKWILLDDGTYGIIPKYWINKYKLLFTKFHVDKLLVESDKSGLIEELKNEIEDFNVEGNCPLISDECTQQYVENIEIELDNILIKLRPYQIYGVKWLYSMGLKQKGVILADEMGLGKTIQALTLLSQPKLNNGKPNLIVVPKSLLFNWANEIKNNLKYASYTIFGKDNLDVYKEVVLITYETMYYNIDYLKRVEFNYIILDEAQRVKNYQSKKYLMLLNLKCDKKLILTGTPIENSLLELWTYFHFLNPNLVGEISKFKKSIDLNLEFSKSPLRFLIKPFILRRTKNQVEKQLPPKIEKNIFCDMTNSQRKGYDIIRDSLKINILNSFDYAPRSKINTMVLEGLLYLREMCCHPKLLNQNYNSMNIDESGKFEELKVLLTTLKQNNDNKIILFSQFTKMLHIIEKWIKEMGWSYQYLDGKSTNRENIVNDFISNNNCFIFLISIKAGGFGLNLQSANTVIIYDPWWNPAVENQAIDRTHRIGQNKTVTVYKLITVNSIEEKIITLQNKKMNLFKQVLENKDELRELFE